MIRSFALALAALAVLVGVGVVARSHLVAEPAIVTHDAAVSPLDVSVDVAPETAHVIDVNGVVERRTSERWKVVAAGEPLEPQDEIRTADSATARIEVGGKTVELGDRTEITVGEISRTIGIELAAGRVSASSGSDGRILRIFVRNSDAVAESATGSFAVLSAGDDAIVATEHGTVKLTARGKSVDVGAGLQSTVRRGDAPLTPTTIPRSLFLKVNAAGGGQTTAAVRGETNPGAVVSVNGVRTVMATEGTFESKVALREGKNLIVVVVEDVWGRRETKTIARDVDTRPPRLDTEVQWK